MMLKTRVIQILTYNSRMMVEKPSKFERPGRCIGTLQQYIKNINSRNVDELILIDIDAHKRNQPLPYEKIKQFTSELFCPLTLGGGISSLADIELALKSGADKVCINSALRDQIFIDQACKAFGSQAIVAAVDVGVHLKSIACDVYKYVCYTHGATRPIEGNYLDNILELYVLGVGEILLTAIHKDGTRAGYDHRLIKEVCRTVNIPVIANGGCAGFLDMYNAIKHGAHAVAATNLFLFTSLTPRNCADYLHNHGVPVRLGS